MRHASVARAMTAVVLFLVATPWSARAATASCSGSAPTLHTPSWPVSLDGVCTVVFTEDAVRPITISLQPGSLFTGTLQAAVRSGSTGFAVKGFFINGTLIYGRSSRDFTIGIGSWQLEVLAGGPPPCPDYPLPCPQYQPFAVGGFAGSVS